ncbi:MAG: CHAT domain-containing protein [Deltaproteobacteria bacterium]|nr:CHAT domain-containing protein [Candidatus Anaeroferrophillacea bacterium]
MIPDDRPSEGIQPPPVCRCIAVLLSAGILLLTTSGCTLFNRGAAAPSPPTTPRVEAAPESAPFFRDADAHDEAGNRAWRQGDFATAAGNWGTAAGIHRAEHRHLPCCLSLIRFSRACRELGAMTRAQESLETALRLAEKIDDRRLQAVILNHHGTLFQAMGDHEQAGQYLRRALDLALTANDHNTAASIYNDLGNLAMAAERYPDAAMDYQRSITLAAAGNTMMRATARINRTDALIHAGQHREAAAVLDAARTELESVEDSHEQAYTTIRMGLLYATLREFLPEQESITASRTAHEILAAAAAMAERLDDTLALSYALGHTGNLHENEQHPEPAMTYTRRALLAAQKVGAPEALYRWQWQSARLLKNRGETEEALAAYRRTIYTLQSIRQEMDGCAGKSLKTFRRTAGTVSTEMIDLLLRRTATMPAGDERAALLAEARKIVELLRVYELRNYFKDDCIDAARTRTVPLDDLCRSAAVIYPIVLADRTELLVSLPTGLKQFTVPLDRPTLVHTASTLRRALEKRTTWEFLPLSRKLYDDLIRPLEPDLRATSVSTLIIVPSGVLRTIPLAALHDGSRFLNRTFATVITPGLNLTDPRPLDRETMHILVAGLTKSTQDFPALPYVREELAAISNTFPATVLTDEAFSVAAFREAIRKEQFNTLHIASHGQFRGTVDQTFILASDGRVTMATLDEYIGFLQFRREPLELLTLSACETAAGDERAALGLAGVAVKAGARSALATLWHINDAATAILIEEFYRQLHNPAVSRAAALQQAQLKLMDDPRYEHPAYWSAFLLISNWQ